MGSKVRLILIAVGAILAAVIVTVVVRDIRRGQNLSEGERLLRAQELDRAERLYTDLYNADPGDPEAVLGLVEIARRNGDYANALRLLRPQLQNALPDPRYLEAAGWVHLAAGDTDSAVMSFTELRSQDPTMAGQAALGLGASNLSSWQGRKRSLLEEAQIQINEAAQRLTDDARVDLWRARLLLAQGRPSQALSVAEAAVTRLEPAGEAFLVRGRIQMKIGNIKAAAGDFERALAEGGNSIEAGQAMAQAAYLGGDIATARQQLAELAQSGGPRSEEIHLDAARLAILAGDLQSAKEYLDGVNPDRGNPVAQLLRVEVLARLGQYNAALDVAANLRRRITVYAPAHFEEARLLMRLNRSEEARHSLKSAFDAAPDLLGPNEGLGSYFLTEGEANNALDYLDAIAEQPGSSPYAVHNCVLAHLLNGDVNGAQSKLRLLPQTEVLRGLVQWYAGNTAAALAVTLAASPEEDWRQGWLAAEMLIRIGRTREALEWLDRIQPPPSAELAITLLRASAVAGRGDSADATQQFERLSLESRLTDAEADACVLGLAYSAWIEGRMSEAASLWSSLDSSDRPRRGEGELNLAWLDSLRAGGSGATSSFTSNLKGAAAEWLQLLVNAGGRPSVQPCRGFLLRHPHHGPALVYLARALTERGNAGEAMELVQRAIELAPGRSSLHRLRAALLWLIDDTDAARESLNEAATLDGGDAGTVSELALLALHEGDMSRTQTEMDRLRENGHVELANRLEGLSLAAQGLWEQAEPHLQNSIDANPSDVETLVAYGVCCARLGRSAEAEELIHDAIRLDPTRADSHRLFGQLYTSRGLYQEAYQALQTSLLLDANQEETVALAKQIEAWINEAGL